MDNPGRPRDRHLAAAGAGADEVTCQQFVELITDYFEGTLEPRTLTLVEEHLVMCDWCVTYTEHMRATIDLIAELKEPDLLPEPAEHVLAALRARREAR